MGEKEQPRTPLGASLAKEASRKFWQTRTGLVTAALVAAIGIYAASFLSKAGENAAHALDARQDDPRAAPTESPIVRQTSAPSREARVFSGVWRLDGDALVGEDGDARSETASIAFGSLTWENYDLTLKIMSSRRNAPTTQNTPGCALRTHVTDAANWYNFAFSGTIVRRVANRWEPVGSFDRIHEFDRWFAVRLEVRGNSVRAFCDGRFVTSYETRPFTMGQVGVQCQDSIVRCKDIRVTDTAGTLLWEGPPTLK